MPNRRFAIATAIAVIAVATPASAGPPQKLPLGRVLAAAVAQNPDLERASVDVDRANAAAFEAAGIDDWLLAATVGLFVDRNKAVEGNVVGTNALDAYSVSAEISRLLSTGGRFGLGFQGRRRKTVFAVLEDAETIDYSGSVALTFEQPLLRGRGEKVARASLKQRALELEAQRLEAQAQVRTVTRQVIHAYWDVALAWEALRIRKGSLQLAQERRRRTQAAIEAGTTAPTESLAVEQIINTREEEILAAELLITQRSLELRRIAFLEIGANHLDVFPTAAVAATPRNFDEAALIEEAVLASPEIAALRKRGEGATLDVEVANNGLLPSLDASLSFGPQGTDSTALGAAKNLARLRGYSVSASLSYQQRLENRAARGAKARLRTQRHRITIDMEVARRQVALAMAQAIRVARSAQKRIQLGERTVALAERNVQTERERFELGRATNFDVLQRQEELKQAQLRLVTATVDLLKAQTTIDSLTGALLDKYGIKVADR